MHEILKNLDNNGRNTWATSVKLLLDKFGFHYVWVSQGVENETVFLNIFEQRVKEHFKDSWLSNVRNSSKLAIYCTLKEEYTFEPYLEHVVIRKHRVALSKLRCSNHSLHIEVGRHNGTALANRICSFCKQDNHIVLEDEYHLLLCCPTYNALRQTYLQGLYVTTDYNTFVSILSSVEPLVTRSVGAYIYHALDLRKSLLEYK